MTYKLDTTLNKHTDYVLSLAVMPNGMLASGSQDTTIKIWNRTTSLKFNMEARQFVGHTAGIKSMTVLEDGCLTSGSIDCSIKIWDLMGNRLKMDLIGHDNVVSALTTMYDQNLASGSWDKTIKIWV